MLKEFDELKTPEAIEVAVPEEQKTQVKYLGSIIPKRGHRIWEVNTTDNSVLLAEFVTQNVDLGKVMDGSQPRVSKKILVKQDCVYVSALNKQNALKRHLKISGQMS